MRVEHYDADTRTIHVLLEDARPSHDPVKMLQYWTTRLDDLKKQFNNMPPTKARQQVALDRDRAQVERNRYHNLLLASQPR